MAMVMIIIAAMRHADVVRHVRAGHQTDQSADDRAGRAGDRAAADGADAKSAHALAGRGTASQA